MPIREPKKKRAKKAVAKKLPETPKDLSGHVIAFGGESVDVQWLDGRADESIVVHFVKVDAYPMWLTLLQNGEDYPFVELSCDKEKDWAANMHPLSIQELKEKAVDLNFTAVQKWAETQSRMIEDRLEMDERFPKLAALANGVSEASSNGSTDTP